MIESKELKVMKVVRLTEVYIIIVHHKAKYYEIMFTQTKLLINNLIF